ncbi:MAG: hypothetical protein HZB56_20350 [Deltaproteobacteria bacterium]|nr:hypothetical protein [Deltaproteobacteria bacterium]
MKHQLAKRMVLFSVLGTMVAMAFMIVAVLFPNPLVLVLAMSVGQGIAILSLALYLLAVALDLQSSGGAYVSAVDELQAAPETPPDSTAGPQA